MSANYDNILRIITKSWEDIYENVCHVYRLIFVTTGRLLGDQRQSRGTKAKSITTCDNAFVTNLQLPQASSWNGNQPHVMVMSLNE
ncbi:hypothetical protein AN161_07680 [Lysinibacillus sp. FJAT-14222]|nr:hypothetical protein AN161_07680 [Lysinibacillus sp. FJAT-14222]